MFRIEPAGEDYRFSRYVVIDHERDAAVQYVTQYTMDFPNVFVLFWHYRIIPFATIRHEVRGNNSDEFHFESRFYTFGFNNVAESRCGIKEYRFDDESEKYHAQILTIEAMLIYGSYYDGDKRPDGYDRFILNEKSYTKNCFGYT